MFTGIIAAQAQLVTLPPLQGGVLQVRWPRHEEDWQLGESIALDGCCLTLIAVSGQDMSFDCSRETLRCTGFGTAAVGQYVNCERALRWADRLGGHFVTGHVDAQGEVVRVEEQGNARELQIATSSEFANLLCAKGSVAVNGVSLTVNKVDKHPTGQQVIFSCMLIPLTLDLTNLKALKPAARIHLEFDVLAKYVANQRTALHAEKLP